MSKSLRFVTGVAVIAALVPTRARSQESPQFLMQPGPGSATTPQGDYFLIPMDLGGKSAQTVAFRNDSNQVLDLRLAAVDAATGPIGGVSYNLPDSPRRDVGDWISLETNVLSLSPGESRTVRFSVTVPPNPRPGQHVGGIAAWIPKESPQGPQGQTGASIVVTTRRVLAVQVELPGGGGPHLVIDNVEAAARPDGLYMEILVRHDGHRMTTGRGFIELESAGFRRDFLVDTFVPATAIRYPIKWTAEPLRGDFTGHVEIAYDGGVAVWDGTVVVGQKVTKELEDRQVTHDRASRTRSAPFGFATGAVAGLGLGLAVPLLILLILWRRKRREDEHSSPAPEAPVRLPKPAPAARPPRATKATAGITRTIGKDRSKPRTSTKAKSSTAAKPRAAGATRKPSESGQIKVRSGAKRS